MHIVIALMFGLQSFFIFICLFILFQQDKNLSNGIFFLELLSAVEPRVVNWSLVTKGETGMSTLPHHQEIEADLNSTCNYIISYQAFNLTMMWCEYVIILQKNN